MNSHMNSWESLCRVMVTANNWSLLKTKLSTSAIPRIFVEKFSPCILTVSNQDALFIMRYQ